MDGCQISGYFDTKFNALGLIEPILHKFEDLKIVNFLTPKRSIFLWHASYKNNGTVSCVGIDFHLIRSLYHTRNQLVVVRFT